MKAEQPTLWCNFFRTYPPRPTYAERMVLNLRAASFSYREIEEKIGVKVEAAKQRVKTYHRRVGIIMPPHRPRHQMTKTRQTFGGYENLI